MKKILIAITAITFIKESYDEEEIKSFLENKVEESLKSLVNSGDN